MTKEGYFSTLLEKETEQAGGFFCQACLVSKPIIEQSDDPRYCHSCFKFLLDEAELVPKTKRPGWIPKLPKFSLQKSIPLTQGRVYPPKALELALSASHKRQGV